MKSENYLMLNGKRIDLTDEQVKTLTVEEKKIPFERGEFEDRYFSIMSDGVVFSCAEEGLDLDGKRFAVANYCTDKAMMEQRALHEILNRLLWRYSEEHGGDNEWDGNNRHWSIIMTDGDFITAFTYALKENGTIYFKDGGTAQSAIEEIVKPFMAEHPEFVW